MTAEIVIDKFGVGNAVVVRQDGEIVEYFLDPPNGKGGFYPPKSFMWAVVLRKINRNGGYFIQLPNGQEGFLISKKKYLEGQALKVVSQVYYEKGKRQRFSDSLKMVFENFVLISGDGTILFSKKLTEKYDFSDLEKILKIKGITLILRSSITQTNAEKLIVKFKLAVSKFEVMERTLEDKKIYHGGLAKDEAFQRYKKDLFKVIERDGVFENFGIWDQLTKIMEDKVDFGSGSYLFIEQTRSFCAIDVNTGSDFQSSKEDINLIACETIFFIIRQRGLGGKMVIDFLPTNLVIRKKILRKFNGFFSSDIKKHTVWGWTRSGSFEIERERDKTPLRLLLD